MGFVSYQNMQAIRGLEKFKKNNCFKDGKKDVLKCITCPFHPFNECVVEKVIRQANERCGKDG